MSSLERLAAYTWGPTELHEKVMKLRIDGLNARILYQSESYPFYRTVWFEVGDHEFTLRLPRKREEEGVWVAAAPVQVRHIKKTLFSDDLVEGIAKKLME